MHISEGVLSAPVLLTGAGVAALGLAYSLRRLPWHNIAGTGILAAVFFVASLIHIPFGPGSVHLIMSGLLGAVLGWAAFPAVTVALFLQAVLFQFGGLTSLGVNTCIMALPAVVCGLLFRPLFYSTKHRSWAAFVCGAGAVALGSLLCAGALAFSGDAFATAAKTIFMLHLPVAAVEGVVTAAVVVYLGRAHPDVLSPQAR